MRTFPPRKRPSRRSASAGRTAAKGRVSAPGRARRPTRLRPSSRGAEATAAMFARLWHMRPKGTTVELRLRSGETIVPEQFLAAASRESRHGVFATVEADATVSLVVIPWDAVDRMTIRGLSEVPKELAESLESRRLRRVGMVLLRLCAEIAAARGRFYYSSSCKSASVIMAKPLAARVSWAISMLSTIRATAA